MQHTIAHRFRRPAPNEHQVHEPAEKRIALGSVTLDHVHHFVITSVTERFAEGTPSKWGSEDISGPVSEYVITMCCARLWLQLGRQVVKPLRVGAHRADEARGHAFQKFCLRM